MSQYTKLTRKVHEHTAKLKALASSAMNGLKPDREDVESRLRMLNDKATCGKHVYVFFTYSMHVCDMCVACIFCLHLQVFCHSKQQVRVECSPVWCIESFFVFFDLLANTVQSARDRLTCAASAVVSKKLGFVCCRDLAYLARKALHALFRLGPEM